MTFGINISNFRFNDQLIIESVKKNNIFSKYIFVVIVFAFSISLNAQQKTNLNAIYELIDKSALEINSEFNSNDLKKIKYISPSEYNILEQRVLFAFSKEGISNSKVNNEKSTLNYSLNNVGVEYIEIFKDGAFGDLLLERKSFIIGSYIFEKNNQIIASNEFEFSLTDTVKVDQISKIENISLPFTHNELPAEPFFTSILEPVIAVGTAVVTVILFFSVRSK